MNDSFLKSSWHNRITTQILTCQIRHLNRRLQRSVIFWFLSGLFFIFQNMSTPASVTLSGPAFSFLLFETSKSKFQQEGFLLGEVVHRETRTITDNDQQQINITNNIKLHSVVPCPHPHYFYNKTGKINKNQIREFLGDQFDKVIGWYKFQRLSNYRLTLRDKVIHQQLLNFFGAQPELFLCCMLINEVSDNKSTHSFSQIFLRYNRSTYEQTPIRIPNLSEPKTSYKDPEPTSEIFNKILQGLKIDRKTTQGLVVINKIQNAVHKHIDNIVGELAEAEQELFELEEEVNRLKVLNSQAEVEECISPENEVDETGPSTSNCVNAKMAKVNSFRGRGRGKSRGRGRRSSKTD
ncbi:unnamed protein product [Acanthoscelides obtectus]|uniref:BRISC complex subunit FAM175B helical domain-containing protein n=1 Tax=Acanthoscelides obtectus TaxID=200917 RepID=A0A9P0P0I6_ACAOB|nr:unnamed protein product [Acanthoscelides obtectus]CAK1653998.1 BRISC complex subunit FAM175B [Acanthoscelides obtectus]